jgi:hypothetical protein
MKKTTIFAAVAASGAFAFAVPDWNNTLSAAPYANPQYTLSGTTVKQTVVFQGCASSKKAVKSDVTMFEDGSYVMYRYDWPTTPTALTGSWSKVPKGSSNIFYLSFNDASKAFLFDGLEADGLAACKTKKPATTYVSIIRPSVLMKPTFIKVTVKGAKASGVLSLKGKEENNATGVIKPGTVSANWKMTGGVFLGPLI